MRCIERRRRESEEGGCAGSVRELQDENSELKELGGAAGGG